MNTKEKIAQVALKLFSTYGFAAVSVRDISGVVGIKESTIYYHYENKYDILKSLQNTFLDITKQLIQMFDSSAVFTVTRDVFFQVSRGFIDQYLLNDFVIQFVKLMTIEQTSNDELRGIYEYYFFNYPMTFQTSIFEKLLASEFIIASDPAFIASHYYSNVFFLYQKHIILKEPSPSDIAAFEEETNRFFKLFIDLYNRETHK